MNKLNLLKSALVIVVILLSASRFSFSQTNEADLRKELDQLKGKVLGCA